MNKTFLLVVAISFTLYLLNLPFDYGRDLKNHTYRRMLTSNDNVPNTFLPYLLFEHHTVYFDNYLPLMQELSSTQDTPYFLLQTPKGMISVYPPVTALFSLPFYIPVGIFFNPDLSFHENVLNTIVVSRVSAAFYTSLTVGLLYLILRKQGSQNLYVYLLFVALGTGLYSIASRGMWMHTPSVFLLTLFLYLLTKKHQNYYLLGLLMGIAVLVRPTNIIFAVIFGVYILVSTKKLYAIQYILAALPCAVFMFWYNHYFFGSFLAEGYASRGDIVWTSSWTESIPGYLLSPGRGLLFTTPLLGLSFVTLYKTKDIFYRYLGIILLVFMLVLGKWWSWSGANAFGQRMLTELIPIFAILAYEVVKKIRGKWLYVFYLLIVYSVYVHTNAVIFRKSRCAYEQTWSFYCLTPPKELPKY